MKIETRRRAHIVCVISQATYAIIGTENDALITIAFARGNLPSIMKVIRIFGAVNHEALSLAAGRKRRHVDSKRFTDIFISVAVEACVSMA